MKFSFVIVCAVLLTTAVACDTLEEVLTPTPTPTPEAAQAAAGDVQDAGTPVPAETATPTPESMETLPPAPTAVDRTGVTDGTATATATEEPGEVVGVEARQATMVLLRVESVGEFSWSCLEEADGSLSCSGRVDPGDPLKGRWTCREGQSGSWECSGNVDATDLRAERWTCERVTSDAWSCSGDLNRSDASMERWTCKLVTEGGWSCEGDIDKATSVRERWACNRVALVWECSREIGRLFPLMVPVVATGEAT